MLAALAIILCCAAPTPRRADQPEAKRTPAPVISVAGADWLERPEREVEDRPDLVLAEMKLKDGDVVADVGAGSGFFTRRLAKAVAPRGKVYANDIQPGMLEILRDNLKRDGISNVSPILGEENDPKLPRGALDWILLVDVYHEFQQPEVMLARMAEALKPTGRVALVEYRGEGTTAMHIRREHRMTKEQALREWTAAGYKLVRISEALPSQRLFIFRK